MRGPSPERSNAIHAEGVEDRPRRVPSNFVRPSSLLGALQGFSFAETSPPSLIASNGELWIEGSSSGEIKTRDPCTTCFHPISNASSLHATPAVDGSKDGHLTPARSATCPENHASSARSAPTSFGFGTPGRSVREAKMTARRTVRRARGGGAQPPGRISLQGGKAMPGSASPFGRRPRRSPAKSLNGLFGLAASQPGSHWLCRRTRNPPLLCWAAVAVRHSQSSRCG